MSDNLEDKTTNFYFHEWKYDSLQCWPYPRLTQGPLTAHKTGRGQWGCKVERRGTSYLKVSSIALAIRMGYKLTNQRSTLEFSAGRGDWAGDGENN